MLRSTLALVLLLSACGDDDRSRRDAGSFDAAIDSGAHDAAGDTPAPMDAARDSAADVFDAGPTDCLARTRLDVDFRLSEPGLAIHPAAAFDGESVWLTYTVREGETSIFDVVMRQVLCDGSMGPTILVNEGEGESDLDSDIAFSGERLLVAYQGDDESGLASAIRPFVRVFDSAGMPLSAPIAVARERDGELIEATNWMVRAAARPGGFWVAGTWGVEAVSGFRAYAESLDLDGMSVTAAADIAPNDGAASQTNLAIGDGDVPWLSWSNLGDNSQVAAVLHGGDAFDVDTGTIQADHPALSGELLSLEAGGGSRLDIVVRNLASGATATIGRAADSDALSDIAGTPEAFAIVWLRQTEGTRNAVMVAGGSESAGTMTLGTAVEIDTSAPAAPYPPFIVALGAGRYFVGWTQVVMSPDFEVHGRIVEL